jgi:hypothetical protein
LSNLFFNTFVGATPKKQKPIKKKKNTTVLTI